MDKHAMQEIQHCIRRTNLRYKSVFF